MARYSGHIKENVAPYAAHKIGVYNSSGVRVGEIPLAHFKPNYGERLYRFGIMSDMHYNDTDDNGVIQDDGSNYHYDLICALKYFNEKEDVSFICAAGDVSTNYITQVKIYHDAIQDNYPSQLVYTCKGNHDNQAAYGNDALWKQYTFPANNPYTTYFFNPSDPSNLDVSTSTNSNSFYFLKPMEGDSSKQDVFVFYSLDYGTNSANSNGTQYYSSESITWLNALFERYKNNRVFLFTHLFFWKKAGNCNEYYYPGNHASQYVLFGTQYTLLNDLNNRYKNVIWFTGHSHYKWDYQPYDTRGTNGPTKRCNVCNFDKDNQVYSAYNVHIPSLARPLLNTSSYSVDTAAAQCGVVDVYEDCVVVRGIDMQNSTSGNYTYTTTYLPVAQYRLPVDINGVNSADEREEPITPVDPTETEYTISDEAILFSELNSMADGESMLCALVITSYDTVQLGTENGSWATASNSEVNFVNKGTEITSEEVSQNETILHDLVQSRVTSNPNRYVFNLKKKGTKFVLSSLDDSHYLTGSTVSTSNPNWSATSESSAEQFTFMNATGTSATSTIVSQNNNPRLLRLVGSNSSTTYLYSNSSPYWINTTSGGYTLMYLYPVTTSGSQPGGDHDDFYSATTNMKALSNSSIWTSGNGISSSTGDSENKAYAISSDFIPVTMGKHYYLSAAGIYSTSNTSGLWCISIYAYDSNKTFIKRITGSSNQATRTVTTTTNYFDAPVNGTWVERYTDFEVTSYIEANPTTAYIKIKYEFPNASNYDTLMENAIRYNSVIFSEEKTGSSSSSGFGEVSTNNAIVINDGALTSGTYIMKYEDESGNELPNIDKITQFNV